jgi:hypothetical protein
MNAPEAKVVRSLKTHLRRCGLHGVPASQILVDADPSYTRSAFARELEPMARVEVGGGRPDLLCSIERGDSALVTGFEVKASTMDWLKGIAQARRYRAGVHHAYLALPGVPSVVEKETGGFARETGVGVLVVNDAHEWHEVTPPADPMPLPWTLGSTAAVLAGAPIARQLQLNHPLNYLVVPYLAAKRRPDRSLLEELDASWPDLGSEGTRRHAIAGARSLRLIDTNDGATIEGQAVADLLLGIGFHPSNRPPKRRRLFEVSPAIAAVARFVLFQQSAVRLIHRVLSERGTRLPLPHLALEAIRLDPPLGGALFLQDPSIDVRLDLPGAAFNPSTVFKLKQNLWHAGLLATGAHSSAGSSADSFVPGDDTWALETMAGDHVEDL